MPELRGEREEGSLDQRTGASARGSGADADAVLAAAVAVALAVAEQAERPVPPVPAAPHAGFTPWLLEGRRRLMDSHGRGRR